jgi:hypothetical protein
MKIIGLKRKTLREERVPVFRTDSHMRLPGTDAGVSHVRSQTLSYGIAMGRPCNLLLVLASTVIFCVGSRGICVHVSLSVPICTGGTTAQATCNCCGAALGFRLKSPFPMFVAK